MSFYDLSYYRKRAPKMTKAGCYLQFKALVPFGRQRVGPDAGGADISGWQPTQAVALLPPIAPLEAEPEAVLAALVF